MTDDGTVLRAIEGMRKELRGDIEGLRTELRAEMDKRQVSADKLGSDFQASLLEQERKNGLFALQADMMRLIAGMGDQRNETIIHARRLDDVTTALARIEERYGQVVERNDTLDRRLESLGRQLGDLLDDAPSREERDWTHDGFTRSQSRRESTLVVVRSVLAGLCLMILGWIVGGALDLHQLLKATGH